MRRRDYQNSLYTATGADVPEEARSPAWEWLQNRPQTTQAGPPLQSGQLADYVQRQRQQARPVNRSPAAPNLDAMPPSAPNPRMPLSGPPPGYVAPAPVVQPSPAPAPPPAGGVVVPVASPTPVVAPVQAPAPVAPVAVAPAQPAPNQWGIDFSQAMTGVPGLPGSNRPAGWNDTMEALNNPNAPDRANVRAWAADPRSNPNNVMGNFIDPVTKRGYSDFVNPALQASPGGTPVAPGTPGFQDPNPNPQAIYTAPSSPFYKPPAQAWTSPDADQSLLDYEARNAAAPPPGAVRDTGGPGVVVNHPYVTPSTTEPPPAIKPKPVVDSQPLPDAAPPPSQTPGISTQPPRATYFTHLRKAVGL